MARDIEIDLSGLLNALDGAAETIAAGAKRGMHDALDDWKRRAVDIAPLDKSTLRRSIDTDVHNYTSLFGESVNLKEGAAGLGIVGEIYANATEKSRRGQRFNYAYYIHEKDAGGKNLRTSGTVKKFLDEPAEQNADKWLRGIETEIEDELKRKGW